jgi:hypothetical protein
MIVELGELSDCPSDLAFVSPVAPQLCDRYPNWRTIASAIAGKPRRLSCAARIGGSGKRSAGEGIG